MLQALPAETQNLGSPSKTASSLLSTPCVKHTDSESSNKTASGSYFSPGKVPTSDSEAAPELEETDPSLLDKYFNVQEKKLLELSTSAAIDGAYDSRGHSADFGKVLAIDLKLDYTCILKLCTGQKQVAPEKNPSHSGTQINIVGGKSGRMGKAGFHRILRWFRSMNVPIHSISTDRSYAFKTEIESYNAEYGDQDAFWKDIALANPYGGTSQCESKNSLDRIYGPKEVYLPSSTYSLYAKLSSLHKNALRIAELDGERVVQR
ncbi:unnamed protein product [Cylicocyclus nassatus]|uniref:Uncharacterized protein n=1 Tax=Cylicocyclus nassatus TaxID=53992 RepID=A0AA36GCM1_CYLNA|nr:unnamed protein product [Cylicocyclus nassatus]